MAYDGISITISLGQFGLASDFPDPDLPPGTFAYTNNIVLYNGLAEKAPGTVLYNANALTAGIVAMFDWWPNTVTQRMICATSDGKLWWDEDGSGGFRAGTPINTGLGLLTPNCQFVSGGNEVAGNAKKLFFFSFGTNQLQMLNGDGTSFSNVTSPATDWINSATYPKVGCIHRGRLWAFVNQQYYASDTANHGNFASNNLAGSIYPGEGGEMKGCFVYKGRLFAFKEPSFVYTLNDADNSSTNWYWQKVSTSFGLSSPNAIFEGVDQLFAANNYGTVTSYEATFSLGSVEAADIFQMAGVEQYIRSNFSRSALSTRHALYYPDRKLAILTARSGYSTTNDSLIIVDYGRRTGGDTTISPIPRITTWTKGSPQCLALRKDINTVLLPIYGDASGFIHLMDRADRLEGVPRVAGTGGGTAYNGGFRINATDFRFVDQSLANKVKNFDYLAVTYVPQSVPGNLSCDYFIDGRYLNTITFPMTQDSKSQLNTLTLNTNYMADGRSTETFSYNKALGTGRTLSLYFYNSGSNQAFAVASVTVGFKPTGEQAQKNT